MSLHILDLDNLEVSKLPGSDGLWTPRWSPNGKYVAALALGTSDEKHSDSSELRLFDFKTRQWSVLATAHFMNEVTWSRNSEYVYFDTAGGPDPALYRVSITGRHLTPLASLKGIFRTMDNWSGVAPDGSPLIVKDKAISEIYALDIDWP
jgi:Tol biopolymer transport system component